MLQYHYQGNSVDYNTPLFETPNFKSLSRRQKQLTGKIRLLHSTWEQTVQKQETMKIVNKLPLWRSASNPLNLTSTSA